MQPRGWLRSVNKRRSVQQAVEERSLQAQFFEEYIFNEHSRIPPSPQITLLAYCKCTRKPRCFSLSLARWPVLLTILSRLVSSAISLDHTGLRSCVVSVLNRLTSISPRSGEDFFVIHFFLAGDRRFGACTSGSRGCPWPYTSALRRPPSSLFLYGLDYIIVCHLDTMQRARGVVGNLNEK